MASQWREGGFEFDSRFRQLIILVVLQSFWLNLYTTTNGRILVRSYLILLMYTWFLDHPQCSPLLVHSCCEACVEVSVPVNCSYHLEHVLLSSQSKILQPFRTKTCSFCLQPFRLDVARHALTGVCILLTVWCSLVRQSIPEFCSGWKLHV